MIYRNVAGQGIAVFAYDATTGDPATGDAANITCSLSLAGGAPASLTNAAVEIDATDMPGWYWFDLEQAETDGEVLILAPQSSTSGVLVEQVQVITQPTTGGDPWATALPGAYGAGSAGYILGNLVSDVWSYATRTLTQTVASITAALCGDELSIRRGDTVVISLTGLTIPADWTRCWFAVKNSPRSEADTDSLLYVLESNPGASTDGLIYLNGAAASSASDAEIVVNQPAGAVTITLKAAATAQLMPRAKRSADLQVLSTSGGVQTLTEWPELVTIEADVVRAIL